MINAPIGMNRITVFLGLAGTTTKLCSLRPTILVAPQQPLLTAIAKISENVSKLTSQA